MAFLNKGLTIVLRDERNGHPAEEEEPDAEGYVAKVKEQTFCYPGGLEDFVAHLNRSKDPIHKKIVAFQAAGDAHQLEVAMQWNSSYSESVYTFANTINTHEGGTHEEGFRAALTSTVNRYARDKKLLKEKDTALTGDDIREGLAAIVSVKVKEPQFEGQTKTKLGNTEVKSFVQRVCNEWLADWFDRNPTEAKVIINKAVSSAQARMSLRRSAPPGAYARVVVTDLLPPQRELTGLIGRPAAAQPAGRLLVAARGAYDLKAHDRHRFDGPGPGRFTGFAPEAHPDAGPIQSAANATVNTAAPPMAARPPITTSRTKNSPPTIVASSPHSPANASRCRNPDYVTLTPALEQQAVHRYRRDQQDPGQGGDAPGSRRRCRAARCPMPQTAR